MNYNTHPKNDPNLEDRIYKHVLMLYYWKARVKFVNGEVEIKTTIKIDDVIDIARIAFADAPITPHKSRFYFWLKRKGIKPLGLRIETLPVTVISSWFEDKPIEKIIE